MTTETIPHPPIVSEEEWRTARLALLEKEKEHTKQGDRIAAQRRRLPMVKVKPYEFDGPEGRITLAEMFKGQTQLIVYHFMYDPEWEKGCGGCTWFANSVSNLSLLEKRLTRFAMISRAPLAKLQAYAATKGWVMPWYSSFGSSFNYDFHVTLDEKVAPIEYNYKDKAALAAAGSPEMEGESHGLSVFFRLGDDVYHTYSSYARGVETLTNTNTLLDVTAYGRQDDFEDSPEGWPQNPTYG